MPTLPHRPWLATLVALALAPPGSAGFRPGRERSLRLTPFTPVAVAGFPGGHLFVLDLKGPCEACETGAAPETPSCTHPGRAALVQVHREAVEPDGPCPWPTRYLMSGLPDTLRTVQAGPDQTLVLAGPAGPHLRLRLALDGRNWRVLATERLLGPPQRQALGLPPAGPESVAVTRDGSLVLGLAGGVALVPAATLAATPRGSIRWLVPLPGPAPFPKAGDRPAEPAAPLQVAVTPAGQVLVLNPGTREIVRFSPATGKRTPVARAGLWPDGFRPEALALRGREPLVAGHGPGAGPARLLALVPGSGPAAGGSVDLGLELPGGGTLSFGPEGHLALPLASEGTLRLIEPATEAEDPAAAATAQAAADAALEALLAEAKPEPRKRAKDGPGAGWVRPASPPPGAAPDPGPAGGPDPDDDLSLAALCAGLGLKAPARPAPPVAGTRPAPRGTHGVPPPRLRAPRPSAPPRPQPAGAGAGGIGRSQAGWPLVASPGPAGVGIPWFTPVPAVVWPSVRPAAMARPPAGTAGSGAASRADARPDRAAAPRSAFPAMAAPPRSAFPAMAAAPGGTLPATARVPRNALPTLALATPPRDAGPAAVLREAVSVAAGAPRHGTLPAVAPREAVPATAVAADPPRRHPAWIPVARSIARARAYPDPGWDARTGPARRPAPALAQALLADVTETFVRQSLFDIWFRDWTAWLAKATPGEQPDVLTLLADLPAGPSPEPGRHPAGLGWFALPPDALARVVTWMLLQTDRANPPEERRYGHAAGDGTGPRFRFGLYLEPARDRFILELHDLNDWAGRIDAALGGDPLVTQALARSGGLTGLQPEAKGRLQPARGLAVVLGGGPCRLGGVRPAGASQPRPARDPGSAGAERPAAAEPDGPGGGPDRP